jgi:hypothetical protein
MNYESFRELIVNRPDEGKAKNGIIFEKTSIPIEDFGIGNALKSLAGFFGGAPKSLEAKKRDEERGIIERRWKATAKGDILHEEDIQYVADLLAQDYNRKIFFELFLKNRLRSNYSNKEYFDSIKSNTVKLLNAYLTEV